MQFRLSCMKYAEKKHLAIGQRIYRVFPTSSFVIVTLTVVSATFLLVCFIFLKESNCETRKNVFYFTSEALFVFEIIKF